METPEFVTENAVLAEGFPMIGCDHDFSASKFSRRISMSFQYVTEVAHVRPQMLSMSAVS